MSDVIVEPRGLREETAGDVVAALEQHEATTARARDTISINPYELVPRSEYGAIREDFEAHVLSWRERGIDILPLVVAIDLVDTDTEDNLPYYTTEIMGSFPERAEWNRRWTTEEGSHAESMIRNMEARGFDMSGIWQPSREHNKITGIHVNELPSSPDGDAYLAVQELLTRRAHMNSARVVDARTAHVLRTIGGDEGRHTTFYEAMLAAEAQKFPDFTLQAYWRQHQGKRFKMPGSAGILGWPELSATIALGGTFDDVSVLAAQRQVAMDTGLLDVEPVTDEGKEVQEWLATDVIDMESGLWRRKQRMVDALRERAAAEMPEGELRPFILGHTVELKGNHYVPVAA